MYREKNFHLQQGDYRVGDFFCPPHIFQKKVSEKMTILTVMSLFPDLRPVSDFRFLKF